MIDTEDKQAWCDVGLEQEIDFVSRYGDRLGLAMNPGKFRDKVEGKYMPDLFSYRHSRVADVKRIQTPFFTCAKYRMDPSITVTLNIKDLFRYSAKYPDILIYLWVTWPEQTNYSITAQAIDGVWAAGLKTLYGLMPEIHGYQKRQDDTKGNAKCSALIDLTRIRRVI